VYDPGNVVHALGHGRTVLLRAVVHVQQSGQRQYVCAGDPDRRQFGQLLISGVRRYGGPERVKCRADGVHPRPFPSVGLDPSGPGHVFAVPGGRSRCGRSGGGGRDGCRPGGGRCARGRSGFGDCNAGERYDRRE